MRKRKLAIAITSISLILCTLYGCAEDDMERYKNAFEEGKRKKETEIEMKKNGAMTQDAFTIWTDPETGVEYIVYNNFYKGGITPRLNEDGTIKINEKFNEPTS